MELLTRDVKKLDQRRPMARSSSEMEGRCRKHPEHRQSQGVCPFCLREKLSHLSAASSSANSFAASSSSSLNSNLSSSPPSCQALAKPEPLRKSRSLAFTIGRPPGAGDREDKEKKIMKTMKKRKKEEENKKKISKKGSFWSARWTLF